MSTPGSYGIITAPVYVATVALVFAPCVATVPIYVQMTGIAVLVIFLGSIRASDKEIARKSGDTSSEPREVLSGGSVYRFPVVASCMLTGLFLAFKYLPKDWVSFCLTAFSTTLGAVSTMSTFSLLITESKMLAKKMTEKRKIAGGLITVAGVDFVAAMIAFPFAAWYWAKKHWLPNNILSISLALSAVEITGLEDFKSGVVLLAGLFFYDIFWVFGSSRVFGDNVMVSVAKQFDGPIKLIFPRFLHAGPGDMSMLGLGDIVIPGFFIAMMLRYDESRLQKKRPNSDRPIFFYTTLCAYFAGLMCTYVALTVFHAAQPALLYLVPACLTSSIGLALSLHEVGSLFKYTESEAEEPKADAHNAETTTESTEKDEVEKKTD